MTAVNVEDLCGDETGRFRGYEGQVAGPPIIDDDDPDSVRFTMQGSWWVCKIFASKGDQFHRVGDGT